MLCVADQFPRSKMKFTVHRTYDSVPPSDTQEDSIEKEGSSQNPSTQSPDDSLGMYDTDMPDGSSIARRGRLYAQRQTRRLVFKDGEVNIALGHIRERHRRYIGDIFTTMLDIRWRYVIIAFTLAFVVSWLVFALFWWIIMISHGDNKHKDDANWQACVANVYDFVTALLYSIETQHTIGYGFRMMESKCPEAILLLMIQSCLGVFIQSLMTGIIFAKLARPKRRADTMMFSKQAVICQRDGDYCLLFRVADMRRTSYIVNTTIRAVLVQNRITKEGELLPLGQVPLEVQAENAVDYYIFVPWPTTIIHKINDASPFYDLSAEQLLTSRFEIIVYLEGTVESTGMTAQVRTSYLPSECLWGHRMAPLVTYQKDDGQYRVDFTQFHATIPCDMPECSAREFAENGESTEGSPPPSLSHHLSFANNLPGLANMKKIHRYRHDQADSCDVDVHGFTIGPERATASEIRKYSKGRVNKGLKRGRFHRTSARRLFGRLNGLLRTTSLDDVQMRSKTKKHSKVGLAETPT